MLPKTSPPRRIETADGPGWEFGDLNYDMVEVPVVTDGKTFVPWPGESWPYPPATLDGASPEQVRALAEAFIRFIRAESSTEWDLVGDRLRYAIDAVESEPATDRK